MRGYGNMKERKKIDRSGDFLILYFAGYVLILGLVVMVLVIAKDFLNGSGINVTNISYGTPLFLLSLYMLLMIILALCTYVDGKKRLTAISIICVLNFFCAFACSAAVDLVSVRHQMVLGLLAPQPFLFCYVSKTPLQYIPREILMPIWLTLFIWSIVLRKKNI